MVEWFMSVISDRKPNGSEVNSLQDNHMKCYSFQVKSL